MLMIFCLRAATLAVLVLGGIEGCGCRLRPKVWWLKGVGRLEWMQVAGEDGG